MPKRKKSLKTEIIGILDRSGSMASTVDDAIGGWNTFIAEQQAVEGEARVSLVLFDNQYEVVYAGKPIAEVVELTRQTFVPRGSTALLDAIGRSVSEQGARIAGEGWADKTIVCILTDGQENSSREFSAEKVKALVTEHEAKDWAFVYLAANQDAFATGAGLGISTAHTRGYVSDAAGTSKAFGDMSGITRGIRGG